MNTTSTVSRHVPWALVAAALVLVLPALAAAQEPVTRFDQLNTRVKVGDTVYVTDAQGREIKGKILDLGPSSLTLEKSNGRSFRSEDVRQIVARRGRPIAKGALWGLGVGTVLGAVTLLPARTCDHEDCQAVYFFAAPAVLGISLVLGTAIGAVRPGKKLVVYRASGADGRPGARVLFAPIVTPRAKGVAVSVSF